MISSGGEGIEDVGFLECFGTADERVWDKGDTVLVTGAEKPDWFIVLIKKLEFLNI